MSADLAESGTFSLRTLNPMASATEPQQSTPAEQLVDAQIESTRRALKLVELTAGLITLLIGVLAFVLVATVLEHWVIPGGWSVGARLVLFALLFLSISWYSWQTFWPLARQSINPAYAAQTIEQSSPTLKNSLLNLLLLRSRKRQLSRQVFQAIEQQAAERLSKVHADSVVDRSAILRLGYVLLVVVALCAIYHVLSPKDFMASAARVLLPWTSVTAPNRVEILDITPGDTSAARGDQVTVSAEVLGLAEGEPVRVLFSTADQQRVGQEIFMSALEGGLRFECRLPGGVVGRDGGLQQDLTYWIEGGDARSPRFKVTVFSRPTLVVQRVQYEYPDYTGYPDREEPHTGDLRAIEGTVVTLTAIANQTIRTAHIDFEADGRLDYLLKAEGQQATVSFPLELRDDRRTPRHQSYVLRYTTDEGRKNELPPKYKIEVTPDYAPEVQLLLPEEESVDVAVDGQVVIEIEARDPDFSVRHVAILGEVGGQQVLNEMLLDKNHSGRFVRQFQFIPSELGLKVGDVVEYWATATDNREPTANLASTKRRKIRVVGPGEGGGQQENKQPGEGDSDTASGEEDSEEGGENSSNSENEHGEQGQEGESNAGEGGIGQESEGTAGEEGEQQGQGGGQNESSDSQENADQNSESPPGGSQPSDSSSQEKVSPEGEEDGEAFERIAEHFEQQDESNQEGEAGEQQSEGGSVDENQQTQEGNDATDGTPDANQEGEATDEAAEQDHADGSEGQPQDRNSEQEGAEGEQSPDQEGAGEEEDGQTEEENGPGGEMSQEQGEAGEGENPGENEGTTDSQDNKKPSDGETEESDGLMPNDQEAPAGGEGETESDSEGGQGGDQSGGGQEGAGQQADADGTGGAGEHQAADEGSGQAEQPGEGDSSKPGGEQQAEGDTGESSENQPGEGSKEGEQPGDQQANAEEGAGDRAGTKPGEGQDPTDEQNPSREPSGNGDSSSADGQQPPEGGTGGDSLPPPAGETQPGDEANLEYAKKQTDLILDKLSDQLKKKQIDESLLEKLGWSQDELRRFVDRWKNLKSQADGEGADGALQELHDALRSLGLGRNRRTGYRSKVAKDLFRDLQDAPRVHTPLEYQEQLRSYIKGTATAEDEN